MFYQNRFTERARQALTLAQESAASFGHSYIGSEHLLLGLLREGGGPAAKALTAAGVTDEALVHQIEELSGRLTFYLDNVQEEDIPLATKGGASKKK